MPIERQNPVFGALGQADALQYRPDAVPRGRFASRGEKPQVLPAGADGRGT